MAWQRMARRRRQSTANRPLLVLQKILWKRSWRPLTSPNTFPRKALTLSPRSLSGRWQIYSGVLASTWPKDGYLLRRLKGYFDQAECAKNDGPAVRSIRKLVDLMVDAEEGMASDGESTADKENDRIAAWDEKAREDRVASKKVNVLEKERING